MTKVEFRLLQVILSPVSGDRVTVALLHWDGTRLRVASTVAALKAVDREHRQGIRVAIADLTRSAQTIARRTVSHPVLDMGLAEVFPVREGMGAALYFTPVITMSTADAEAHFLELRRELRLDRDEATRARRVTLREMSEELKAIGTTLKIDASVAGRVRTDFLVALKTTYPAPLSWQNGRWHHAVPLSFDGLEHGEMEREIQRSYGLVKLSFPRDHVAVIVPALPQAPEVEASGRRELDILSSTLGARAELMFPERREGGFTFDSLVVRIRKDIGASH